MTRLYTTGIALLCCILFAFSLSTFNEVSAQDILLDDGFEDGTFNPAFWTAVPNLDGAGNGRVDVVNSTSNAHSGTFSAWLGRETDGDPTTNALDLRLDLSGRSQIELRYWLRDYFDEVQDNEGLYFSDDDGANFVKVAPLTFDDESDNVYLNPPPIDVDALAALHGLSLNATFVIRFQQTGTGNFSTSGDEDGFMIDDVLVQVPEVEYATLPFEDGFESSSFGSMWQEVNASEPAIGVPTAPAFAPARRGGLVDVVNSTSNARTGTFSAWLGRTTDGPSTTNALDLRLDLAGHTQVELRYWLRDFFDEAQDQEGLYFSDDGGLNFVHVVPFDFDTESDNVYLNPPPVDVDALAALNGLELTSTFVIRFQQIGTGNFSTSGIEDGFMIDDVSVMVPAIEYATLPFEEGFESGTFRAMWQEVNASDPSVGIPTAPSFAPARRGGLVDVVSSTSNARTGTFSAWLGRTTDGPTTTNALDLRLDLSSHSQVELRYWLRDFFDEAQEQEGLYFSDDGGLNFVQVVTFAFDEESDNAYLDPPPVDVDALAALHGLSLTSTFVIRFQQIGTGNFSTSGIEDGFMIDDLSVTEPEIEYVGLTVPVDGGFAFEDGFESGVFGPMWQEVNASDPSIGQPTAPEFAPARRGGRVDVVNSGTNANSGSFAVWMGRTTDGPSTTNALDLRLNLEGQTEAVLRFELSDYFDETQAEEGLYFSDDGGQNFVLALPLDPSSLSDRNYGEQVVDIASIAGANGLMLSSNFVIRFQQIGTGNFSTSGIEDGFFIDDVSVVGNALTDSSSTNISIEEDEAVVSSFVLQQNFPNPFNPVTTIPFEIAEPSHVRLTVFNMLGQEVAVLIDEERTAGNHAITFSAQDLPSGMYIYTLESRGDKLVKHMVLLK